ncbi:hypothetical protein BBJ28_00006737 [Nothophytophthora sp. Chile5]|nr:hypothetical protein BBJ28_00006734 [Nothophytophthora sp. Chile5]RLN72041.1 hypothetical protein BBJ28_00006737 [Nothophytophthora sp. Chile5]
MADESRNGGDRAYVPRRKRRRVESLAASTATPSAPSLPHSLPSPYAASAEQEAEWARRERGISVEGEGPIPTSVHSFADLPISVEVIAVLQSRGVMVPSPIQAQALPCVFQGRDVVALAPTGSGKTLCYILPMLALLQQQQQQQQQSLVGASGVYANHYPGAATSNAPASPVALVVVPTRELMDQVVQDLKAFFSGSSGAPVVGVCGGVALDDQLAQLKLYSCLAMTVVATPGRLLHLVERHGAALSLARLALLVVDEVDRVLQAPEMEAQLRLILQLANAAGRQTLLFSATLPAFLPRLARSAVLRPVTVRVGNASVPGKTPSVSVRPQSQPLNETSTSMLALSTTSKVTHDVQFMRGAEKPSRLLRVLRATERPPVLVFCNSRASVDRVARLLRSEQFHAAPLHGGQSQGYRTQALRAFRAGYVDVLVASDVASRGLDLPGVDHVVLFDMPLSIEDYVHRCGRTGRHPGGDTGDCSTMGKATSFLTRECAIAAELKEVLRTAKQPVPRELDLPNRFHPPPIASLRDSSQAEQ